MSKKTAQTAATTRSSAAAPAAQVISVASYIDRLPFHCDGIAVNPVRNDSGRAIVTFCMHGEDGLAYAIENPNETYVGSDGKTYRANYQLVISANLYKLYLDVKSTYGEDAALDFLLSAPISTVTSQSGESFVMVVSPSDLKPMSNVISLKR